MHLRMPLPRHNQTEFIQIDIRSCIACGQCVAACSRNVLGLLSILRHRHVHVDHPDRCKGCYKCIKACEQRAIQSRQLKEAV